MSVISIGRSKNIELIDFWLDADGICYEGFILQNLRKVNRHPPQKMLSITFDLI